MSNNESFEKFKDTYVDDLERAIGHFPVDVDFFTRAKAEQLVELLQETGIPLEEMAVLDVGCGPGITDKVLKASFKHLHGVDTTPGVLEKAKENNPEVEYRLGDGNGLPYADGTFDVSFAICVVHHVLPEKWSSFILEMQRVTKPGGLVVVFEHNPLNPMTLYVVNRCEFDEDANLLRAGKVESLFRQNGLEIIRKNFILFFPFSWKVTRLLESFIRRIPLGAQYFVAGRKPLPKSQ